MTELLKPNSSVISAASPASSLKQWFAVYTAYRREQRVADYFAAHAIDHYLPIYHAEQRWKLDFGASAKLALFPCYVFVRITEEQRIAVLKAPDVLWMVGNSGSRPVALPEREIDALRHADPSRLEPHPYLANGERVRIRCGRFAGIEGILVRRRNSLRVVISLDLIMQSIAIEVSSHEVESVDLAAPETNSIPSHAFRGEGREFALCQL